MKKSLITLTTTIALLSTSAAFAGPPCSYKAKHHHHKSHYNGHHGINYGIGFGGNGSYFSIGNNGLSIGTSFGSNYHRPYYKSRSRYRNRPYRVNYSHDNRHLDPYYNRSLGKPHLGAHPFVQSHNARPDYQCPMGNHHSNSTHHSSNVFHKIKHAVPEKLLAKEQAYQLQHKTNQVVEPSNYQEQAVKLQTIPANAAAAKKLVIIDGVEQYIAQ